MSKKFIISNAHERGYKTGIYFIYFLIIIFVISPAVWIVIEAFKTRAQVWAWPPTWFPWPGTLNNFIKLFTIVHFERAVFNSLMVSCASSFTALGFAAVAAYGFSRFQFKYKYLLLILLIGLQMMPATANIVPLFFIAYRLSLYNTRLGVILLLAGIQIPFTIWILKGFFDSVPTSIEECASLDGANRLQVLTKILLPLILPGLSAAFFITFIGAWNQFIIPMIIIGDNAKQVAVVTTYQFIFTETEYPELLSAAAMVTTFPMLLIFYGFQKLFISGLTTGYEK